MNQDIGFAFTIGITITLALVGGIMFGLWLNAKFNMSPWGILIGMFVGIILATTILIVKTRTLMK